MWLLENFKFMYMACILFLLFSDQIKYRLAQSNGDRIFLNIKLQLSFSDHMVFIYYLKHDIETAEKNICSLCRRVTNRK